MKKLLSVLLCAVIQNNRNIAVINDGVCLLSVFVFIKFKGYGSDCLAFVVFYIQGLCVLKIVNIKAIII